MKLQRNQSRPSKKNAAQPNGTFFDEGELMTPLILKVRLCFILTTIFLGAMACHDTSHSNKKRCINQRTRCDGNTVQRCTNNTWQDVEDCSLSRYQCIMDEPGATCVFDPTIARVALTVRMWRGLRSNNNRFDKP